MQFSPERSLCYTDEATSRERNLTALALVPMIGGGGSIAWEALCRAGMTPAAEGSLELLQEGCMRRLLAVTCSHRIFSNHDVVSDNLSPRRQQPLILTTPA